MWCSLDNYWADINNSKTQKNKTTETDTKITLLLELSHLDFRPKISNSKKNFSRELEYTKIKQMGIIELKNTILTLSTKCTDLTAECC